MWMSVLIKEAPLYRKWRQLQKTTVEHKVEISKSWEPRPRGYVYITAHVSTAQGAWHKRGGKSVRAEDQGVCCETYYLRNACINKSRTVATSIDILIWKGKKTHWVLPLDKVLWTTIFS